MSKKGSIKVVDVSEVIPSEDVIYNESLLSVEHDTSYPPEGELGTYIGYWPVSENRLKQVEKMRFKRLSEAVE